MKIFKLSRLDFYLPYLQRQDVSKAVKDSVESLKSTQNQLNESRVKIEKNWILGNLQDSVHEKIRPQVKLNEGIGLQMRTLVDEESEKGKFLIRGKKNETDDKIGKIFYEDLEIRSLEDIFYTLVWKKEEWKSEEFTKWAVEQTYKVILNEKIDLDFVSRIYEFLCHNGNSKEPLWICYNDIVTNHFFSFSPEELVRIMKSYKKITIFYNLPNLWINQIPKIQECQLKDFKIEEISVLVYICDFFSIKFPFFAMKRLKSENIELNNAYNIYVMKTHKKFLIDENIMKDLLENMSLDMKCELACMQKIIKFSPGIFEVLLDSIDRDQGNLKISYALDLCDIILHLNSNYEYASKLANKFQGKVGDLDMDDYAKLLEILCILKNTDQAVSEKFMLELETNFYRFTQNLNHKNIYTFVHFFSYSMPMKSVHNFFCSLIINSEQPDSYSQSRPEHDCYKRSQSGYLVYNNSLLTHMHIINLIDLITCLPFKYQITTELWRILKKYLNLIYGKYFYMTSEKHRMKIILMLSKPENFHRDIIESFLDKFDNDESLRDQIHNNYIFFQAIKNLKNIGYSHPLFFKLNEEN